jgi:hypothetical protein
MLMTDRPWLRACRCPCHAYLHALLFSFRIFSSFSVFECGIDWHRHQVIIGADATSTLSLFVSDLAGAAAVSEIRTPANPIIVDSWQMITVTVNTQQQANFYINGQTTAGHHMDQ